ncbi:alpha/beta hydrolase [Streptomyces sp. YC504]|uniref:Alpha/beta hydrolase n=1 Tax=Streptomyces mesophilus TaxID=1775132 RepID=A0A6G4XUI6_9ACTN|nr:alpha/beta hydrolase [Streptomyces mesophilus]NGO80862.1 alpha/beta hydrolase [Streptomyces mesophilus]
MSRLMHVTSGPYAPPVAARELVAVSSDGSRLHVEVHGPDGAPAVVLVHGWTCSTAFWAAQIRELARDHRVIAYDQRGHGRTPAPAGPTGYSVGALVDDLEAVLATALEPGEQAVLVGHSMGGMTLMAAAGRPKVAEHAAAVLLCSTGTVRLADLSKVIPLRAGRLRTRLTRGLLHSAAPLGPVTPLARRIMRYATMGPGSSALKTDACTRIVHACPRRVRQGWGRVLAALDIEANVAKLTVPTAVIVGTADRMTPPEAAEAIAAALPDCVDFAQLPGIGHMTPVEAPDLVTAQIRQLVAAYALVRDTSAPVRTTHAEVKEGA